MSVMVSRALKHVEQQFPKRKVKVGILLMIFCRVHNFLQFQKRRVPVVIIFHLPAAKR
ncbi:unnamed protein product, partial [Nesidiocoris tenuis]